QTAVLYQVVKLLFGIGKMRVRGFDDGGGSALKWFLGRNAVEPALSRKLFVLGEVEADEEFDGFGRRWRFGLVFCGFLGLAGFGGVLGRSSGDAFKFEEQFFVEAIGLFPTLEFVAG